MSFIRLDNVSKKYKIIKRDSGFLNAVKSFFSKNYEIINAVNNISFTIDKGEIVGYIGPNGAGKSTTIKMLCGILMPDEGKIEIDGMNPFKERQEYVKNIGVVFGQKAQLWWDIPVEDSFDLLRDIYKIDNKRYLEVKEELVTMFDIKELIRIPVRQLSLGQRMKCELVASLLHEPKILFLDEPTIGLDATSKLAVRELIKKINKEKGVTVLLTTHDMTDIEALASRVLVIGHGSILYDGTINNLKKKYVSNSVIEFLSKKIDYIDIKGVELIEKRKGSIKISVNNNIVSTSRVLSIYSKEFLIDDIEIDEENIDDVIVKMYREYRM